MKETKTSAFLKDERLKRALAVIYFLKRRGFSQYRVSKLSKISWNTMRNWIKGKYHPQPAQGASLDRLMKGVQSGKVKKAIPVNGGFKRKITASRGTRAVVAKKHKSGTRKAQILARSK